MIDLEEEVAYLRRELGLCETADETSRIRQALNISTAPARLLGALFRATRPLSHTLLLDHLGSDAEDNCLAAHFSQTKRKVGSAMAERATPGFYRLTAEGRRRIGEALLR